jgi:hypothetical protein
VSVRLDGGLKPHARHAVNNIILIVAFFFQSAKMPTLK